MKYLMRLYNTNKAILTALLAQVRKRQQLLFLLLVQLTIILDSPWKCVKKWRRILKKLGQNTQHKQHRKQRQLQNYRALDIRTVDLYSKTGIYEDDFEVLYEEMRDSIEAPRSGKSTSKRSVTKLHSR